MYFKLPLLCLLVKYSYKHKIPDKVANIQDGRFDLTWNQTIYHCSTQLKIGTFSSCKLSGIFPFVYMHDGISNLLLDMQFYFIVYWAQRYIPTFLRTMPLEGTEGILHL